MQPEPITIVQDFAPGDNIVLSGVIRDLALTHPGRYRIYVRSRCRLLWKGNPYVQRTSVSGSRTISANYAGLIGKESSSGPHFLKAYHTLLEQALGVEIPTLYPHGDLYPSDIRKVKPPFPKPYWLLFAGGKKDATPKIYPARRWQAVVDLLRKEGVPVVQSGARGGQHIQPKLHGVVDKVGWGGLEEFVWQIYHAEGIIGPVTAALHAAAVFHKPYVCVAGGREHWFWEAYTNEDFEKRFGPRCQPVLVPNVFLHTIGQLPCCENRGCWAGRVLESEKGSRGVCRSAVLDGDGIYPECLTRIDPEQIVEAVLSFREFAIFPSA